MKLNILSTKWPTSFTTKGIKNVCAHIKNYVKVLKQLFFFFSFFGVEYVSYFLSPGMEAVSPAVEAES